MGSYKHRVVIVDNHQLYRDTLEMIIKNNNEIKLVGTFYEMPDLNKMINDYNTNVLLIDENALEDSGISITEFKQRYPLIKLVLLSILGEEFDREDALKEGADSYVFKQESTHNIINAITTNPKQLTEVEK